MSDSPWSLSRREVLAALAAAGLAPLVSAAPLIPASRPVPKMLDRAMRWVQLALVEKGENGGKDVVIQESKAPQQSCSAEQKEKVKSAILAYVKTGPELGPIRPVMPRSGPAAAAGGPPAEAGAADGGAAAKASAPAPAPAAKKK